MKAISLLVGILVLTAGTAPAANITIYDGQGTGTGWNGAQEDNEVAANCIANQSWDLEGFYLDGTTLSMVGGYNFAAGQDGYTSGDIFFDVNRNVKYGVDDYGASASDGIRSVTNQWGYDYAIDLNFVSNTYTVYEITGDTLLTSYYRQNDESNPWAYSSGGTQTGTGAFSYNTGLTNAAASAQFGTLTGGTHNVVSLDLSGFINSGTFFTTHFTMGCGNDNLMGQGSTPVPEPGTLLLLGVGLVGLAGIRKRKRN